jgi:SEC-C motif-containing protein
MRPTAPCPCGSDEPFGRCCLPLHLGERQAETAEQLMRARYSAYAVDTLDYVWQTWHPRTRPSESTADTGLTWTGLEIVDTVEGLSGDESGEVEFRAHYVQNRRSGRSAPVVAWGTLHERSRFAVRARRWFYVDGDLFR